MECKTCGYKEQGGATTSVAGEKDIREKIIR